MPSGGKSEERSMSMSPLPAPLDTLSAADRAVIDQLATAVSFPAGSCIFKVGAQGDACYLLDAGVVSVRLDRQDAAAGSEIDSDDVLGYLEAPAILGELALLDGQPRSASAYAQSDVLARRLDAAQLAALLAAYPTVAAALYAALGRAAAHRLRQM